VSGSNTLRYVLLTHLRYHSHHGVQTADGLFGPLIIHSAKEKEYQKIKYSTDRVFMIQDYYHDLSGALMPGYLANNRENTEPVPGGALINGQNTSVWQALRF
jgi:FtsP/CotA-like multicopper oxidase with cupredoxin domain